MAFDDYLKSTIVVPSYFTLFELNKDKSVALKMPISYLLEFVNMLLYMANGLCRYD